MSVLSVSDLFVNYGPIAAIKGVSFEVREGSIVTLIGANGAGKSSILRAISGLIPIHKGDVRLRNQSIRGLTGSKITSLGMSHCPEGRGVFSQLTVKENLEMGGYIKSKAAVRQNMEKAFVMFPKLRERMAQKAGTLSGGEQQMLAIGRALMSEPGVLLLDEPSLGLAPQIVKSIFTVIREINARGTTVLLVEQNAKMALQVAHEAYVLETGTVTLRGSGKDLLHNAQVQSAYLGG